MAETLTEQLIRHEGLKLKPYKCTAGKLTIGVGRNIEDIGITKEEAMVLLDNDIFRCRAELLKNLPFILDLDSPRQNVLVNMCFNLGWPRLSQFKNMLAAIQAGDFKKASEEMLNSAWAKQVGARATELAAQMEKG